MAFKIHNMFSPSGKVKVAKTKAQHSFLKNMGYSHTKPKNK